MLSVVALEVCMDVVGFSVEAIVKDDVSDEDSMEDVTTTTVELGISCDVSDEVGIDSEVIVETGGTDSVDAVDGALSVMGGVVAAMIVELFTWRTKSFIGAIPPACALGPTDTRPATATKRRIVHNTYRPSNN